MTLDDFDLFAETPANPAAPAPRKCRRHAWGLYPPDLVHSVCIDCGKVRNDARAALGRRNRARGNAIERAVAKRMGLRRVGQYGGPDDIRGIAFSAQVKSGGAFPERLWRWLKAVPVDAGQTALVVVTDAPGPGHKRRAVVVLDLEDWIALHGETV